MRMRTSQLAIGAVVVIAICMWVNFRLSGRYFLQHLPPAAREELLQLRAEPQLKERHLRQLVAEYYPVEFWGLSIARAICQAHGGAVTASNRAEGGTLIRAEFAL